MVTEQAAQDEYYDEEEEAPVKATAPTLKPVTPAPAAQYEYYDEEEEEIPASVQVPREVKPSAISQQPASVATISKLAAQNEQYEEDLDKTDIRASINKSMPLITDDGILMTPFEL